MELFWIVELFSRPKKPSKPLKWYGLMSFGVNGRKFGVNGPTPLKIGAARVLFRIMGLDLISAQKSMLHGPKSPHYEK